MRNTFIFIFIIYCSGVFANNKPQKEFYQITVYHFSTAQQEHTLDNYFQNALLPALHRNGYKNIGVFKSLANDTVTDKTIYVFVPLKNLELVTKLPAQLNKDSAYKRAGAEYLNAVYTAPPYTRMEIILTEAFPLAPQMQLPQLKAAKNERV